MSMRILIVDDSHADRMTYRRAIQAGMEPPPIFIEAASLKQAQSVLQQEAFECILLDNRLPDGSGIELLEQFQQSGCLDNTAVIYVTGAGSEKVATQAMKLGASDYLVKDSLDPELLVRAIQSATAHLSLKKQLDDARKEQELFVSVVAHDVKAPLNKINLLIGKLQHQMGDQLDDNSKEIVQRIISIADHGIELVESLLSYTKSGRGDSNFSSVDLNDVLAEVSEFFSESIQSRGGELRIDRMPGVTGDRNALKQLFQNLIGNAIKYCDTAPVVRVHASASDFQEEIIVEDNGIGIPADQCDQIFLPLKRVHKSGEYEGIGMGLAICQRILDQHGGSIVVESAGETGSRFVVKLPKRTVARP